MNKTDLFPTLETESEQSSDTILPDRAVDDLTLPQERLLRVEEVARILKLGRSTVYQMCRRRELPYIAINHSIRIPATALKRWVERRTNFPEEG